jgi:hypothetical protein
VRSYTCRDFSVLKAKPTSRGSAGILAALLDLLWYSRAPARRAQSLAIRR